MQIVSSEHAMPARLTCSGCRYWARAAFEVPMDAELAGRCDRFAETRAASARPRCNICWEPAAAAPAVRDTVLADD